MKKLFVFFCFLLSVSTNYGQGIVDGFYQGKGNGTIVLGIGFEDTKNFFVGNERADISRSLYYANVYGAYGISETLETSISLPYIISNQNRNLQDVSVFLKYQVYNLPLANGKLQFNLAIGISTPVSNYSTGGLNDIGQQATIIESRGIVHYQFNSGWFATLLSGYSFKFGDTPNSVPITFKTGKASVLWYYDVFYDFQHSFGGIDYLGTPRPQNFREFGVDYHKVGGSLYRTLSSRWGGYVSLSYIISGRNVFQGPGYGLGAVYRFGKD